MSSVLIFVILAVAILVIGLVIGLVAFVNGRKQPPSRPVPPSAPSGHDHRGATHRGARGAGAAAPVTTLERPEGTASRLVRLRERLARSQGGLGRGLLKLLSRDRLDEDTWEEIEDTLITADVGVVPTQELVERLRTRLRVEGADAGVRPSRCCARSCSRWSTRRWTGGSASPAPTASRASCSSWASTAPARPPRSASSPACSSPRTSPSCSAPPTPSAPPRPSS